MLKRVWISVMFLAVLASVSLADTITVTPNLDTYLNEDRPDSNFGARDLMPIVSDHNTGYRYRPLVQFDLSSLNPLTTEATSATLSLKVQWCDGLSGTMTLGLYRVLRPWVEGAGTGSSGATTGPGATWNDYDRGMAWSGVVDPPQLAGDGHYRTHVMLAGTDYVASAFGTAVSSGSLVAGSTVTFNLSGSAALAVIQDWIENPSSNYGFVIIGNRDAGSNHKQINIYSRENADNKPKLDVTYNVIPEPASLSLLMVGGLALLRRRP